MSSHSPSVIRLRCIEGNYQNVGMTFTARWGDNLEVPAMRIMWRGTTGAPAQHFAREIAHRSLEGLVVKWGPFRPVATHKQYPDTFSATRTRPPWVCSECSAPVPFDTSTCRLFLLLFSKIARDCVRLCGGTTGQSASKAAVPLQRPAQLVTWVISGHRSDYSPSYTYPTFIFLVLVQLYCPLR